MSLTDKNIREKKFHNELQSKVKGRFENIFYKAIYNSNEDFFDFLKINSKNSEILDYGCGIGASMNKVIYFNPKKVTGIDISDRFIEDGSYLRVKSVRLAYNFPLEQWGLNVFDYAQIFVSGTNLLTFTKYTGLDPEMNTRGTDSQSIGSRLQMGHDQSGYPNAKNYTVGLRLSF